MASTIIAPVRLCLDCSADISARHALTLYCSTACKERARYRRARAGRLCHDCHIDISLRHGNAWLCVACVKARKQTTRNSAEYKAQQQADYRRWRQTPKGKAAIQANYRRFILVPATKARRRAYYRRYLQTLTGKIRNQEKGRRRRARQRNQLGIVTDTMLAKLYAATKCAICNRRFSKRNPRNLDHVVPLAKGGLHDDSNLQALCARCNFSKGVEDPISFAQRHGRLL